MLIGRWSSDDFLHYIRKQVEQFSKVVAKKMLMHRSFWTIPDVAPRTVSNDDPRQRNHGDNAERRKNYWMQHVMTGATTGRLLLQLIERQCGAINGGGIISPIAEGVGGGES
jgi:hypothetical protein